MKLAVLKLTLLLTIVAAFTAIAQTQPAPAPGTEIVVGTRAVSPFVSVDDAGQFSGFSIDLWRAIAAELGLRTRFQAHETLPSLLEAVRSGSEPVGIAAISITAERTSQLDFSQPMFRSGLSILVRAEDEGVNVLAMMFSPTMLTVIGILALVILVPAHIFWWIARGRDEGLPIREPYVPGIFDAIFWCAESMGGAPQGYPRRVFPRVVALVWLYAGILLISYFTAFATTSLTLNTLRGSINSPADLAGRSVAAVSGSTGAEHVKAAKARVFECPGFEACAKLLMARRVDALVYDTPVLQHYATKEGRVRIAGVQFHPENYGIAFPVGSPLRREVNQALLKLMENGTYDSIMRRWLGMQKE